MKKIESMKYIILLILTVIISILWLMGITLLKNSWYNLIIIVDFYFLRKYFFEKSKSFSIDRIMNRVCILGIVVCAVGGVYSLNTHTQYYNYMYSPNKTHRIVIKQSGRNRDGFLDIYKQHFFLLKSKSLGQLTVKRGNSLMTADLLNLEGNVFSGNDYYKIGQISFKWVTEDELSVYCEANETSISIKF